MSISDTNNIQLTLEEYEKFIGYRFKDREILSKALTHKSYSNENQNKGIKNNERLEFLGDAVLGFVITDLLVKKFPNTSEGVLSKYRSDMVNEKRLAEIAKSINLGPQILLGKGESESCGYDKDSILSSALEALLAAIFLDGGYEASHLIVTQLFSTVFNQIGTEAFSRDYKTKIQQYTQEHFKSKPVYKVFSESGPDHDKVFEVELIIENNIVETGQGNSKKQAEQDAAKKLLEKLAKTCHTL